jgi:hypothetical protein
VVAPVETDGAVEEPLDEPIDEPEEDAPNGDDDGNP